ncbi:MAG: DUF2167 domain-containing protein [Hyphomonadaceae bacterium]
MNRKLSSNYAAALLGGALLLSGAWLTGPALADGPAEIPPHQQTQQPPPQTLRQESQAQPQTQQQGQIQQGAVRAGPVVTQQPVAEATAAAEPQTGQIALLDGAVTLNVPAGYQFWPATEAQAYLQRANAQAPRGQVLGVIAPVDARPTQADFWGSIVSYEPVGYVPPGGAAELQAATFIDEVRAARQADNRPFLNFATAPAFDPTGSLTWAETTVASGPNVRDLRHEQRLLGRTGVVSLTTLARSDQLGQVTSAGPNFASMVSFPQGARYADYNPQTDQTSIFDLAGLVANRTADGAVAEIAGMEAPQGFVQQNSTTETTGGGLQGWFPWIAIGVVVLAAIGWFAMGRRNRDIDQDGLADEDEADIERERAEETARREARDEQRQQPDSPPA